MNPFYIVAGLIGLAHLGKSLLPSGEDVENTEGRSEALASVGREIRSRCTRDATRKKVDKIFFKFGVDLSSTASEKQEAK